MTLPFYQQGQTARQVHVGIPNNLWEEEHGRQGFYGPVSHVYHAHPPTSWQDIDGPLKPRAYDLLELPATHDVDAGKTWLLGNEDVRVALLRFNATPSYAHRNADGDEVLFIHQGEGTLHTDYGVLPFAAGWYVVVPKGVTYRWQVNAPCTVLAFETTGAVGLPERGLLGQHALFDPDCILRPALQPYPEAHDAGTWPVRIQRLGQTTVVTYPYDPIAAVKGWKGNLYPFALNTQDIRPVSSHLMHLAPSIHTTFVCQGAVVCTFMPRPLEQDPAAVRVPFYHRNIDYDELLFYHDGDFFSRDGIKPGMATHHPAGIHHGPHPKAFAASWQKTHTDELAVMLDTVKPLTATVNAAELEWPDYYRSWQTT
jgi:homogentisate 1,2-dioxygenase